MSLVISEISSIFEQIYYLVLTVIIIGEVILRWVRYSVTRTAKIVPNCSNVTDERNKKHAVVKGLTLYGQDWKRYKGMSERRKTPLVGIYVSFNCAVRVHAPRNVWPLKIQCWNVPYQSRTG